MNDEILNSNKIPGSPGCDSFTRPEEISALSKFLGKKRKKLEEETQLGNGLEPIPGITTGKFPVIDKLPDTTENIDLSREEVVLSDKIVSLDKNSPNFGNEINSLPDSYIELDRDDNISLSSELLRLALEEKIELEDKINKLEVSDNINLEDEILSLKVSKESELSYKRLDLDYIDNSKLEDEILSLEVSNDSELSYKRLDLDYIDNSKLEDEILSLEVRDNIELADSRLDLKITENTDLGNKRLSLEVSNDSELSNKRLDLDYADNSKLEDEILSLEVKDNIDLENKVLDLDYEDDTELDEFILSLSEINKNIELEDEKINLKVSDKIDLEETLIDLNVLDEIELEDSILDIDYKDETELSNTIQNLDIKEDIDKLEDERIDLIYKDNTDLSNEILNLEIKDNIELEDERLGILTTTIDSLEDSRLDLNINDNIDLGNFLDNLSVNEEINLSDKRLDIDSDIEVELDDILDKISPAIGALNQNEYDYLDNTKDSDVTNLESELLDLSPAIGALNQNEYNYEDVDSIKSNPDFYELINLENKATRQDGEKHDWFNNISRSNRSSKVGSSNSTNYKFGAEGVSSNSDLEKFNKNKAIEDNSYTLPLSSDVDITIDGRTNQDREYLYNVGSNLNPERKREDSNENKLADDYSNLLKFNKDRSKFNYERPVPRDTEISQNDKYIPLENLKLLHEKDEDKNYKRSEYIEKIKAALPGMSDIELFETIMDFDEYLWSPIVESDKKSGEKSIGYESGVELSNPEIKNKIINESGYTYNINSESAGTKLEWIAKIKALVCAYLNVEGKTRQELSESEKSTITNADEFIDKVNETVKTVFKFNTPAIEVENPKVSGQYSYSELNTILNSANEGDNTFTEDGKLINKNSLVADDYSNLLNFNKDRNSNDFNIPISSDTEISQNDSYKYNDLNTILKLQGEENNRTDNTGAYDKEGNPTGNNIADDYEGLLNFNKNDNFTSLPESDSNKINQNKKQLSYFNNIGSDLDPYRKRNDNTGAYDKEGNPIGNIADDYEDFISKYVTSSIPESSDKDYISKPNSDTNRVNEDNTKSSFAKLEDLLSLGTSVDNLFDENGKLKEEYKDKLKENRFLVADDYSNLLKFNKDRNGDDFNIPISSDTEISQNDIYKYNDLSKDDFDSYDDLVEFNKNSSILSSDTEKVNQDGEKLVYYDNSDRLNKDRERFDENKNSEYDDYDKLVEFSVERAIDKTKGKQEKIATYDFSLPLYKLPGQTFAMDKNYTIGNYLRWAAEELFGTWSRGLKNKNVRRVLLEETLALLIWGRDELEKLTKAHKYRLPGDDWGILSDIVSGGSVKDLAKSALNSVSNALSKETPNPINRPVWDKEGNTTVTKGWEEANSRPGVSTFNKITENKKDSFWKKLGNDLIGSLGSDPNDSRKYKFIEQYLTEGEGIKTTLLDFTGSNKLEENKGTVESFYDLLKTSPYFTTSNKITTTEGGYKVITLDSNMHWEVIFEPYIGDLNGNYTFLPPISEINLRNKKLHGVQTAYNYWIPINSFELQKEKLNTRSLGLFDGEIVYPVSMEFTNEFRMTIVDDQYKSWRNYFERCVQASVYNSTPVGKNGAYVVEKNGSIREVRNKYGVLLSSTIEDSVTESKNSSVVIDRNFHLVAPYKNLTFRCRIYVMTPQLSTINKYDLLLVLKDFSEERSGEIDSSGSDLNLSFSIVGENPPEETTKWDQKSLSDNLTNFRKERKDKEGLINDNWAANLATGITNTVLEIFG